MCVNGQIRNYEDWMQYADAADDNSWYKYQLLSSVFTSASS